MSVEPGYTATNLNQYQGTQSPEQAAAVIVNCATLPHFMTGNFYDRNGAELAW